MLRIVDCLTVDHDPLMVVLAAMVCLLGVSASAVVAGRVAGARARGGWLALLGTCAGATAWSTHFIAMLAYSTRVPMTYDPGLTGVSFFAGVVLMGAGFAIAARPGAAPRTRLAGGVVVGGGVVALHYLGMAALRFPGQFGYDADLVVASVLASIGFGAATAAVMFRPGRRRASMLGAALMLAMIVSLHFVAMGAVRLELGLLDDAVDAGLSRNVLAAAVTVAALAVALIGMLGAIIDQRVSHRLAAEAERFRTLAEGALEGLVVHRDGVIVDANRAARTLLGLGDSPAGQRLPDWLPVAGATPRGGTPGIEEIRARRQDGATFPVEIGRRRIALPDGDAGELLALRDLTARRESEARVAHLALHDPLTDLPNRRFFAELAAKAMAQAQRVGGPFALLALDLDGFKSVNDLYGHETGDELLRTVAARISAELGEHEVLCRLGGDEFAIVQGSPGQPKHAMQLAQRLLEVLRQPVALGRAEIVTGASIGVAVYPQDGARIDHLLRNADTAMLRAKADGKATYRFFEEQMDHALEVRRKLESRLRRAIAEGGLDVAFQPIVDARSRRTVGFETLVRWHDAELGHISPADFIPVAEETGLVVPLGEYVLRRACREAARWPQPLYVAVNLSAVQFKRPGLVAMVTDALHESGLPGGRLVLEVTETLLVENRDEALRVLDQLKSLDVRIAMDDFGTGYSSLGYLKSFPFDKIKIDRVFVSDVCEGDQAAGIVKAVIALGRSLRMRVVAEGVETEAQAEALSRLECDQLQGFLVARPMPAAEVQRFLAAEGGHADGERERLLAAVGA